MVDMYVVELHLHLAILGNLQIFGHSRATMAVFGRAWCDKHIMLEVTVALVGFGSLGLNS